MQTFIIVLILSFGTVLLIGWVGLHVKPRPFPHYPAPTPDPETVELPTDLPPPVARFFKTVLGDRAPVIESAVLTGSATLRVSALRFPARFRITHIAGQGYRHFIEATFFGLPVLKVNETYLDGKARLELPFGVVENEPKVDMAANLGLWAECVWLPSTFLTDPRVRWEAIDQEKAHLVVPFGAGEDSFTATFDLHTGLLRALEAKRYRDARDEEKIVWRNQPLGWQTFHGVKIPSPAAVIWMDQGVPWSVWTIEDVAYNIDVSEYIRASGL